MEILRFAHHFFHFESHKWKRATAGKTIDWKFARSLFESHIFPLRQLQNCSSLTFENARDYHDRQRREEEQLGIRVLSEDCIYYPQAIRDHIPPEHRPALLYLRGGDIPLETQAVAIVGTRKPSERGIEWASSFSSYLGAVGVRVVSGLARGIDTIAHEQNIAGTVAILGGGVGSVYPTMNQELAERILQTGGSLLAPFPLGQVPLPQNFPERNMLIAALSLGTIVIEGAEKSGAAITGRQALQMGKTVVALTQDFRTEFGRGAIRLQQEGAVMVTREEEALEAIFRRVGGFQGSITGKASMANIQKSFSFSDFQTNAKVGVAEAVALLEEGIMRGRIERWGSRYRLRD